MALTTLRAALVVLGGEVNQPGQAGRQAGRQSVETSSLTHRCSDIRERPPRWGTHAMHWGLPYGPIDEGAGAFDKLLSMAPFYDKSPCHPYSQTDWPEAFWKLV